MIQGFCTRWVTDQIIKPFVKSANGLLHEYRKEVDMLSRATWLSFKEEDLKKYPIVVFGILRGTGDLIKNCEKIVVYFLNKIIIIIINKARTDAFL